MTRLAIKSTWAVMLLAAALMGSAHAKPAPGDADGKPASSKARKKSGQSAKAGKIKFLQGSVETTKERSTRLARECKGRVNAGACAGYTQ